MRVLLATDGSTDALTATRWLRHFPVPGESSILVLTVAAVVEPPVRAETMERLRKAILDDARRIGEEAQKILARRWPAAEARVSEGDAREAIVRAAQEWRADLVVVGARGLGAVKGFFLGSVSLAVARQAPCPVLVVKGRPRGLRRALVALDGSESSLDAVRFLAGLGLERKLRVTLLGVLRQPRIPPLVPRVVRAHLGGVVAQLQQEQKAEVEAAMERAAALLRGKVGAVDLAIPTGRPAGEIVRAANGLGADLIVVGARGVGGVERLLGSVSEEVLHAARCPVLIAKRVRRAAPET